MYCALLAACMAQDINSRLSRALGKAFFPSSLNPASSGDDAHTVLAKRAFKDALSTAADKHSNTADVQHAITRAIPLQLMLHAYPRGREALTTAASRALSLLTEDLEHELCSQFSLLDVHSHELHSEVEARLKPVQQELEQVKAVMAVSHGIQHDDTQFWDGVLLEARHPSAHCQPLACVMPPPQCTLAAGLSAGGVSLRSSLSTQTTQRQQPGGCAAGVEQHEPGPRAARMVHVRGHGRACGDRGAPAPPAGLHVAAAQLPGHGPPVLPPPPPAERAPAAAARACSAVSLNACGCCMSRLAAEQALSAASCSLCSERLAPGSGHRGNACMTRAAQAWAAGVVPRVLREEEVAVDERVPLWLPPRAVADGRLCNGTLTRGGGIANSPSSPCRSAARRRRSARAWPTRWSSCMRRRL